MRGEKNTGKKRRSTVIFDAALILVILAAALSVFLIFGIGDDGAYARVTVDGVTVGEYPLSEDGEYVLNGGTNTLVIKDGRAYMKEASCPDRTCITRHKSGIMRDGETIICLPNRVCVEIYGGE